MGLSTLAWTVITIGIVSMYIIALPVIKSMKEDGIFDTDNKAVSITIRIILFILSPILLPLTLVTAGFYFLFDFLIDVLIR